MEDNFDEFSIPIESDVLSQDFDDVDLYGAKIEEEDDKLVVVPEGKRYDKEQIEALVEFQERFFKHAIIEAYKE